MLKRNNEAFCWKGYKFPKPWPIIYHKISLSVSLNVLSALFSPPQIDSLFDSLTNVHNELLRTRMTKNVR